MPEDITLFLSYVPSCEWGDVNYCLSYWIYSEISYHKKSGLNKPKRKYIESTKFSKACNATNKFLNVCLIHLNLTDKWV